MPVADNLTVADSLPAEVQTYQVNDVVELVADLPARSKLLRAGARGVVRVVGLPWGGVSVELGQGAASRVFQLMPRHLRLIERAPVEAAS